MELKLVQTTASLSRPADALLVRGETPTEWLAALQFAGISLSGTTAYALPGMEAGSLWGCILVNATFTGALPPAIERLQLIGKKLLIPEWSSLFPMVAEAELVELLGKNTFLLHPQIGLVDLEEPLEWARVISIPILEDAQAVLPAAPVFRPAHIKSVEVRAADPEKELIRLEGQLSPDAETLQDEPLSISEKAKMALYKALLAKDGEGNTGLKGFLQKMLPDREKMEADLAELERRNQSALEKLLQMLKDNPSEALKYAIPMGDGTERGDTSPGGFGWLQRWNSLSLWGNDTTATGRGSTHFAEDQQFQLMQQYRSTALKLIAAGKYHEAAFVYLKLLKEGFEAADALEQGGDYAGAAALFLKHTSRKDRAAACYEKGHMITEAIALYKELKEYEKVGDLYMQLSRRQDAMEAYKTVSDDYISRDQYLKAAALHRNKMEDTAGAQELLLKGWKIGKDTYNCLHTYCRNTVEATHLQQTLREIYETDVTAGNTPDFLRVLQGEMDRNDSLNGFVRDMAYGIIAARAAANPTIVSQMPLFNKGDRMIDKDVLRYKAARRR